MEFSFFSTLITVIGVITIIVTMYYMYERTALLDERKYRCPSYILKSQVLADKLLLGKYFVIFLYGIELGLLGFGFMNPRVDPLPMSYIANSAMLLYLIANGYSFNECDLDKTYRELNLKWGKGEINDEYHEDEVNLYRAIRDAKIGGFITFIATLQLFVLIIYII